MKLKNFILILSATLLITSSFPFVNAQSTDSTFGSLAALQTRYYKKEVYITMRDGVKLFTSIYTPGNIQGKNPVLLNRTPYNIEPEGATSYN